MRASRRPFAPALATVGLGASLAVLSGVPYDPGGTGSEAVLRLSWRTRIAAVRECREPAPEELARLPAHMRRDRICDWRVPPHRLRVTVDGRVLDDMTIEAAGVRGDRPLYVFREFGLAPGTHELEIRFFPEVPEERRGETAERDEGESGGERVGRTALALRARVDLAEGEVALVTHDPDAGRLVIRRSGEPRGREREP